MQGKNRIILAARRATPSVHLDVACFVVRGSRDGLRPEGVGDLMPRRLQLKREPFFGGYSDGRTCFFLN